MDEREIRARAAAALASVDETLQRLQERQQERAERGESDWVAPQPPEPAPARQRPRQRPAAAPSPPVGKHVRTTRNSNGDLVAEIFEADAARSALSWEQFIRSTVEQRLTTLAEGAGQALGKACAELREEITEQKRCIAALESTVTELLAALERKVDDLEGRAVLRPIRPRLVSDGGPDGAA